MTPNLCRRRLKTDGNNFSLWNHRVAKLNIGKDGDSEGSEGVLSITSKRLDMEWLSFCSFSWLGYILPNNDPEKEVIRWRHPSPPPSSGANE